MKIAPLAEVKAQLSAFIEECETQGPVVITRNGKAMAVLVWRRSMMTTSKICFCRVRRAFAVCLPVHAPASSRAGVCRTTISGR